MMYLGQDAIGLNHTLPAIGQAAILESGTYTPQEDIKAIDVRIPHSLGELPDFCLYFSSEFTPNTTYDKTYCANGYFAKCNLMSPQRARTGFGSYLRSNKQTNNSVINVWYDDLTNFFSTTDFTFPRYNSGEYLKGNITYYYIIGKFKEVTPNA